MTQCALSGASVDGGGTDWPRLITEERRRAMCADELTDAADSDAAAARVDAVSRRRTDWLAAGC